VDIHYSIWLSVIPTLLALAALAFAWRTSRAAQQAVTAARPPAETRRAPLAVTVLDGRARRDLASDAREYAFLIALENGTGAETTITEVELRVSYRTRANFCGAVDVPMDVEAQIDGDRAATRPVQPHLQIPLRLGGGQAVSGWIEFRTANVIPRHCRIDGYVMIVTDAGGARATSDASLPMVLRADTDGRGPATWGWD
jgi:hypothetical protein